MIAYLKEILYLLGSDRKKLPAMILLFLAPSFLDLAGLGLIGPYVTLVMDPDALDGILGRIVDIAGLTRDQHPLLVMLGLVLIGIFLMKTISGIGINWIIIRFSQQQQLRIRSDLMQSYQMLPYTKYLGRNSSEYIYSMQDLTGKFAASILVILRTMSDGIVGLMIVTLLIWTNALAFALLVGMMGSLIFLYDRLFSKKMKIYGMQINIANTSLLQSIQEGMDGLKEIRVMGRELFFLNKLRKSASLTAFYRTRAQLISTLPRYLTEFMTVSFIVLLVVTMLFWDQDLKIIASTLSVFAVAVLRLVPFFNNFSNCLNDLRHNRDSISRLYKDFEQLRVLRLEKLPETQNSLPIINPFQGHQDNFLCLELRDIGFRYPNAMHDALQNISLKITVGESVGFIGPSGAGKTTLVDILLGLLTPQKGAVYYNGIPLEKTLLNWRTKAAYLPQEVFLIDNTLRSNVALGVDTDAIDEIVLCKALQMARLTELVEQLPHGVDTLLGERGLRLSGGQRQRIALARAFYYGRNVLVMDEATSALDNETEQEIIEEIKYFKGKKTIIVIAHRLSTVKHCDRIYRLEHGRITQVGSSEEFF